MAIGNTNSKKNIMEYLSPSGPAISVPELEGTFNDGVFSRTITKSGMYNIIARVHNSGVSAGVSVVVNGLSRGHFDPIQTGVADYIIVTFYAKSTDTVQFNVRGTIDITANMIEIK